jgi:DUF218 domain
MRIVVIVAIVLVCGIAGLHRSGEYLVLDHPNHADVVVALAGDRNDCRFSRGLALLRQGYAPHMLVDANSDMSFFGRTAVELEDQRLRSLVLKRDQVRVCPIKGDSTDEESSYVEQCLDADQTSSVLLVTSDFHTRRALSIFQHRLPRYHWSITACHDDSVFKQSWWQRREWAKTAFMEWTKLIWWETVDRWRQ